MLKAGMEGVKKKIEPMLPFSDNVYHLTEAELKKKSVEMLPEHLGEAIDTFQNDPLITEALGGYIAKNLVDIKRQEFEDYMSFTGQIWSKSRPKITSWEMERYLTRC